MLPGYWRRRAVFAARLSLAQVNRKFCICGKAHLVATRNKATIDGLRCREDGEAQGSIAARSGHGEDTGKEAEAVAGDAVIHNVVVVAAGSNGGQDAERERREESASVWLGACATLSIERDV